MRSLLIIAAAAVSLGAAAPANASWFSDLIDSISFAIINSNGSSQGLPGGGGGTGNVQTGGFNCGNNGVITDCVNN